MKIRIFFPKKIWKRDWITKEGYIQIVWFRRKVKKSKDCNDSRMLTKRAYLHMFKINEKENIYRQLFCIYERERKGRTIQPLFWLSFL